MSKDKLITDLKAKIAALESKNNELVIDNEETHKICAEITLEYVARIAELEEIETDLNNTIGFLESGAKEAQAQLATAHDSIKSLIKSAEWVSVEVRLPDCEAIAMTKTGVVFHAFKGEVTEASRNVTHWMPIPPLPDHPTGMGKKVDEYIPLCQQKEHGNSKWPCPEICGEMCVNWNTDKCKNGGK
jgi:hypothetical protein